MGIYCCDAKKIAKFVVKYNAGLWHQAEEQN